MNGGSWQRAHNGTSVFIDSKKWESSCALLTQIEILCLQKCLVRIGIMWNVSECGLIIAVSHVDTEEDELAH